LSVAAPVTSKENGNEPFAPVISIRTSETDSKTGLLVNVYIATGAATKSRQRKMVHLPRRKKVRYSAIVSSRRTGFLPLELDFRVSIIGFTGAALILLLDTDGYANPGQIKFSP
jgi:hypothetical protein